MTRPGKILQILLLVLFCVIFAAPVCAAFPSISKDSLTVTEGKTAKLTLNNGDIPVREYQWMVLDKSVIRLHGTDQKTVKLEALKPGKTLVKIRYRLKGNKESNYLKCEVRVREKVVKTKKISINLETLNLTEGNDAHIRIRCDGYPVRSVKWFSTDTDVIRLKDTDHQVVYIKAAGPGTASAVARVRLKGDDREYTYSCRVTVMRSLKHKGTIRIGVVDLPGNINAANAVNGFRGCGAAVCLISSTSFDLNKVDGVVFPGGGDVNPVRYHQHSTASTGINNSRDALQLSILKKCIKLEKPVFGICRGLQIINVGFGGSLRQHIMGHHTSREVALQKGAVFFRSIYPDIVRTVHSHHQCIAALGDGLIVAQKDTRDGVYEAIEHKTLPVYAVQYHPELMGRVGGRVMYAFIRLCRYY